MPTAAIVSAASPMPKPGPRNLGVVPMTIRHATRADGESIRQIYNLEVLESTHTFDVVARSVAEQDEWMAAHSGVYPAIVGEIDGSVVGFVDASACIASAGSGSGSIADSGNSSAGSAGVAAAGFGANGLNAGVVAAIGGGVDVDGNDDDDGDDD